jgi:hypothetical protein
VNEPVVDMDRKRDSEVTQNEPDAASRVSYSMGFPAHESVDFFYNSFSLRLVNGQMVTSSKSTTYKH